MGLIQKRCRRLGCPRKECSLVCSQGAEFFSRHKGKVIAATVSD